MGEYIVQEGIDGFTRNWETRCFWFNGKFLYAIANKAAVSSRDGKEHIVTGDDIPKEFLENAKRIGAQAIKVLPQLETAGGRAVKNIMVRTDIGCSDSQVYDRDTTWDPNKRTFFLNEIEPSSTTYFTRWLKFDTIPTWARLYAQKAREIYKHVKIAKTIASDRKAGKAKKALANIAARASSSEAKAKTGARKH